MWGARTLILWGERPFFARFAGVPSAEAAAAAAAVGVVGV